MANKMANYFLLLLAMFYAAAATPQRAARYVAFDPPMVFPPKDYQTVKAGTPSYGLRCESGRASKSSRPARGVSWRLPADATDSLRSRVRVAHRAERGNGRRVTHVAELTIADLRYDDTGTFVCTYNGTRDTGSIDNSTRVHLYVEDDEHLLKQSGVEFLHFVQSTTAVIPCQPTHPDVNVTLRRDGSKRTVDLGGRVNFDPRVRLLRFIGFV